jgi:hypothetical protein
VVHFQILNGNKAGTSWVARRFPVRVGRSSAADLALSDPGVWDEHLRLALRPDGSVEAVVPPPAIASLNGETFQQSVLHSGDVLNLGSVQLRFGLSPVQQRSLRLREIFTWLALAALCLGQVTLIYLLG